MNIPIRIILLLSILLSIAGCETGFNKLTTNESYYTSPSPWKKIAVLPFYGLPEFKRISGEWLAFQLQNQARFEIVPPTLVEIELAKKGMTLPDKTPSVEEAQKSGRLLGVDAVITGKVGVFLDHDIPAGVEAQLIDTLSGNIVATAAKKGQVLSPVDSVHEMVMSAVEATSRDLLLVLEGLAEGKLISGEQALEGSGEGKLLTGE